MQEGVTIDRKASPTPDGLDTLRGSSLIDVRIRD